MGALGPEQRNIPRYMYQVPYYMYQVTYYMYQVTYYMYQVTYYVYLASGRRLSYTPSVERVVS